MSRSCQCFARDDEDLLELFFDDALLDLEAGDFPLDPLPRLLGLFEVEWPFDDEPFDDLLTPEDDDDDPRPPETDFEREVPLEADLDREPALDRPPLLLVDFDDEPPRDEPALLPDADDRPFDDLPDEDLPDLEPDRDDPDEERLVVDGEVTVSAAAPIAPTAAPVAAPLSISPATSSTLSMTRVVVVLVDDLREPELFPDVPLLLRELPEVLPEVLVAMIYPQCSIRSELTF